MASQGNQHCAEVYRRTFVPCACSLCGLYVAEKRLNSADFLCVAAADGGGGGDMSATVNEPQL